MQHCSEKSELLNDVVYHMSQNVGRQMAKKPILSVAYML